MLESGDILFDSKSNLDAIVCANDVSLYNCFLFFNPEFILILSISACVDFVASLLHSSNGTGKEVLTKAPGTLVGFAFCFVWSVDDRLLPDGTTFMI